MNKEEIILEVEKVLDNWDPLGVLKEYKPIAYSNIVIGEYSKYIKPIIQTYLKGYSIDEFLLNLYTHIRDYPSENIKVEIKEISKKLVILLSAYDRNDIKKSIE